MAQPAKIPVPFATDSTACNVIPETTSTPGLASWREGFPLLTSTPIADGGKAPKRADFNGIFNALSEHVIWAQNGNVYEYDNLTDYVAGNLVAENGTLYVCVAANGPGSSLVDPATDTAGTAWKPLMIATNGVLGVSQGGTGQTSLDSVTVGKAKALNTARDINGTSFNGTANITTSKWGTARNITVKDATQNHSGTSVSVDGSAAANLLLPSTIDADVTGNAATATAADAADALTTGRDIQVDLASTVAATFDGSSDVTPGVTGTLGVTNGGTGENTLPPMLMNALAYSATENYTPGTLVTQNDELFVCLTANGPLSTVIAPSADSTSTYWSKVVSQTAMDSAVSAAIAAEDASLMSRIFAQSTWYKRPELPTPNQTTITIPAGTQVAIDSAMYISTSATTLTLDDFVSAADRTGKDVYIYACVPALGTEPDFVLSLNSTVPSGYTATNSRKIGGFHCECADVGTITGHPLSGYLAGDILPASVWDLLHRAETENVGLVFVNGKWYAIYDGYQGGGASLFNAIPYGWNHSGEMLAQDGGKFTRAFMSRDEFIVVSQGSNQMTAIGDTSLTNNTGGHVDSNGRRMISNYGLEDCCGWLWQYTSDVYGAYNGSISSFSGQGGLQGTAQTTTSTGTNVLTGYALQSDGRGTTSSTHEGNVTNVQGLAYGALVRVIVGGDFKDGAASGSRSVRLDVLSGATGLPGVNGTKITARYCSLPRIVNL